MDLYDEMLDFLLERYDVAEYEETNVILNCMSIHKFYKLPAN